MIRISARFINLVDSYNDRYYSRFGMIDFLNRLRHDAVICRDDEDGDIRDLGTARAHGRERLMARRIEEYDLLALAVDLICTDMLRDTTSLVRLYMRVTDTVEQ